MRSSVTRVTCLEHSDECVDNFWRHHVTDLLQKHDHMPHESDAQHAALPQDMMNSRRDCHKPTRGQAHNVELEALFSTWHAHEFTSWQKNGRQRNWHLHRVDEK